MEMNFDRRRQDMELRLQEAQLEAELNWLEQNPGQTPPWIQERMNPPTTSTADFVPATQSVSKEPMSLGLTFEETDDEKDAKRKRNADGTFKKKEK